MKTENDLRVWWFRNSIDDIEYYPVKSVKVAIRKIKQLADKDRRDRGVVMNGFGLEVYDVDGLAGYYNDGWEEYYNEDGFDIEQIMESQEKRGDNGH